MKSQFSNRVIIIGGNHQNTLAAIRCFGICGCNIHVLLHAEQSIKTMSCAQTKFSTNRTSVVDKNENSIVNWLLENRQKEKQLLFPCSDLAAFVIDNNYKKLEQYFFMPGFRNNPGMVCTLMSKWEQYLLSHKLNVKMAKSWLIFTRDEAIPNDIVYPCIVKPSVSAFGTKSDITICHNETELQKAVETFSIKKYVEVIVQEYLEKTLEFVAIGCIFDDSKFVISDILKKTYTLEGNTTFATFVENKSIESIHKTVVQGLINLGYHGMYDIEYLVRGEEVFLLEINFRQSGVEFGQIGNKVYAPYIYGLSEFGEIINENQKTKTKIGKTIIDETVCLTHRKEYGISIVKWLWIFVTASACAKFNIHDIKGTVSAYLCMLLRK